jgi:hypothetical protein
MDPTIVRSRRAVLIAGATALLGIATLGATSAAAQVGVTASSTATKLDPSQIQQQRTTFLNTLASKLGVSNQTLTQALSETEQAVGPMPLSAPMLTAKPTALVALSDPFKPAATALNIGEDQLQTELVGKSLTDVAKAHNVDPQVVASALKSQRNADLDQAVKNGTLPSDMATNMRTNLDAEIQFTMSIVRPSTGNGATMLFVGKPPTP